MHYAYVLENTEDRSWYIGYTGNLKTRLSDHNSGKGGQFTRRKASCKLIYYEAYIEKADALGREKFLKGGSGRKYLKKQLKHYLSS